MRVLATVLLILCFHGLLLAQVELEPWQCTAPMLEPRADHGMAAGSNAVYVVGGFAPEGNLASSVEYSPIDRDGFLVGFTPASPLNQARAWTMAVATDTHVYAIGGASCDTLVSCTVSSVEFAAIQPDGSLGAWQFTALLNGNGRAHAAAILHGDQIYLVGGYRTGSGRLSTVETTTINPDGTLAPWTVLAESMTVAREKPSAGIVGNVLVAAGGLGPGILTSSEWTTVLSGGGLNPWQPGPPLAMPRYRGASLAVGNTVFAVGGYNNGQTLGFNSVESAVVGPVGPLGWVDSTPMQEPRIAFAACRHGDWVYVSGGNPANGGPSFSPTVERSWILVPADFIRGDCNGDGVIDVSDPVALLGLLFLGDEPACRDGCDANDDGGLDIADVTLSLNLVFGGVASPLPPFPDCGADSNPDPLSCGLSACVP
ncbi:MAG: hypothetical protein AB7O52_17380 [Planctomycetota bacterium]